jgi:hypothetical protein
VAEAIESHAFRALVYFIAGAASLWAGKSAMESDAKGVPWLSGQVIFWFGLALVLISLGVLKSLEVEQWAARQGRDVAHDQGWYNQRQGYQEVAIAVITVVDGLAFAFGVFTWARRWMFLVLPMLVFVALVGFVGVRAISLHQVDTVLYRRHLLDIQISAVIEVTLTLTAAIIAMCFGVLIRWLDGRSSPRRTSETATLKASN